MSLTSLARTFAERVLGLASPLEARINALIQGGAEASPYYVHSGSFFAENVRDALLASKEGFSVDQANQIKLLLQNKICQLMALPEKSADAIKGYDRKAGYESEARLFQQENLQEDFDCFYFQPAALAKACRLLAEDLPEESAVCLLKAAADALIKCDNDPNRAALGIFKKATVVPFSPLRTMGHLLLVSSDVRQPG